MDLRQRYSHLLTKNSRRNNRLKIFDSDIDNSVTVCFQACVIRNIAKNCRFFGFAPEKKGIAYIRDAGLSKFMRRPGDLSLKQMRIAVEISLYGRHDLTLSGSKSVVVSMLGSLLNFEP